MNITDNQEADLLVKFLRVQWWGHVKMFYKKWNRNHSIKQHMITQKNSIKHTSKANHYKRSICIITFQVKWYGTLSVPQRPFLSHLFHSKITFVLTFTATTSLIFSLLPSPKYLLLLPEHQGIGRMPREPLDLGGNCISFGHAPSTHLLSN